MSSRREFLAAGAAALAGAPLLARTEAFRAAKIKKIGIQLYTVRGELGRDVEGTLSKLAAIGFSELEFAGYPESSVASLRKLCDRLHLKAVSNHFSSTAMKGDWNKRLDQAATMGQRYVAVADLGSDPRDTRDDWKRLAGLFNRAGEQARARGLRFAYHNHDAEFVRVGDELGYDILLKETDPALVEFEADLYWMTKAGQDPVAYFEQWPGRFPLVHIKDMDNTPKKGFTELGRGVVDFARILAHHKTAGIKHYFYEQDETTEPVFEAARTSFAYLRDLRF